jgi:hypothetical protein
MAISTKRKNSSKSKSKMMSKSKTNSKSRKHFSKSRKNGIKTRKMRGGSFNYGLPTTQLGYGQTTVNPIYGKAIPASSTNSSQAWNAPVRKPGSLIGSLGFPGQEYTINSSGKQIIRNTEKYGFAGAEYTRAKMPAKNKYSFNGNNSPIKESSFASNGSNGSKLGFN